MSEIDPREKTVLRRLLGLRGAGTFSYRLRRPDAPLTAIFKELERRGLITMEVLADRIILPSGDASLDYTVRLTPTGIEAAREADADERRETGR